MSDNIKIELSDDEDIILSNKNQKKHKIAAIDDEEEESDQVLSKSEKLKNLSKQVNEERKLQIDSENTVKKENDETKINIKRERSGSDNSDLSDVSSDEDEDLELKNAIKKRKLDEKEAAKKAERDAKKKKEEEDEKNKQQSGYSWEDKIQRPWDIVGTTPNEDAQDQQLLNKILHIRNQKQAVNTTPLQRGIIRSMIIIIDMSQTMAEKDYRPSRFQNVLNNTIQFIQEFFNMNPISQLGVVSLKDGLAQVISPLNGSPKFHVDALLQLKHERVEPRGFASLQNGLELARGMLMGVSTHCTKEVVLLYGSLSSTDPGNIMDTVTVLKEQEVRVAIIGLVAQVNICEKISRITNMSDNSYYNVAMNEQHFSELLMERIKPLPLAEGSEFTLIKMGFPTRIIESTPSFCSCHSKLNRGGYYCPSCNSKVCNLPIECPSCELMLILSTHLARSYHHLIPLKNYQEVPVEEIEKGLIPKFASCFSCKREFPLLKRSKSNSLLSTMRYRCVDCEKDFCMECDDLIHGLLHNCPGCESKVVL
ncbi:hypothetical protein ACO0SA_000291 [Hanseniaspora valbyensis]